MPGIAEALALPKMPGLHGLALSGAGPSVLAIAESNFDEIGRAIAQCFRKHRISARVRLVGVDNEGCKTRVLTKN